MTRTKEAERPFLEQPPDRVKFATGMLLDADDFRTEQDYHRSRLARVLVYLHGSGTVAGLRVQRKVKEGLTAEQEADQEQIEVLPGLAIDRLGRLIELRRPACIRISRWLSEELLRLRNTGASVPDPYTGLTLDDGSTADGLVADVFIRFVEQEHSRTPAFASGSLDALDSVVHSRIRESCELELVLRAGGTLPRPDPLNAVPRGWPSTPAEVRERVFENWQRDVKEGALEALEEHIPGQDPASLLLARLIIPTATGENRPPTRVVNHIRAMVYPSAALAALQGLTPGP